MLSARSAGVHLNLREPENFRSLLYCQTVKHVGPAEDELFTCSTKPKRLGKDIDHAKKNGGFRAASLMGKRSHRTRLERLGLEHLQELHARTEDWAGDREEEKP
jgi:hypothetical protein